MTVETSIRRQSPVPLHEQFKQILLEKIQRGQLKKGDALAPERELCERYGLSRTTVRQALSDLVERGVLQRIQGRGTFVTRRAAPLDLHELTSFTQDMKARGRTPSSEILDLGMVDADPGVADALELEGHVFKVQRLRKADGMPVGVHTSYLPPEFAFSQADLSAIPSLYALLEQRFGLELVHADETLRAMAADASSASLLDVAEGTPILHIDRITYDPQGTPKEFCEMHYRADQYVYHVRLKRY